jgi:ornithine carbamoyltransferase
MAEHYLTVDSLGPQKVRQVLDLSRRFKANRGRHREVLAGGQVGMLFNKPSTRTRVSFEMAARELGMLPTTLRPDELQLGHGETIADTARVLSRYLSALAIRTFEQALVEEVAAHATIPIINALTDEHHPLQALADTMTIEEEFKGLAGVRVAFIGDGNNVCHSLAEAAGLTGFSLVIATPDGYRPDEAILAGARARAVVSGGSIVVVEDPAEAVAGADAVYTDVWASMGKEAEAAERARIFVGYTVNADLMARASARAIFLHCLPAHRGSEVTDEVMDGPQSRVWDQAENRAWTEQAILYALITGDFAGARLG